MAEIIASLLAVFFPCSIDREYLYGYAADGYRSPLWLCASHNGYPVLVHRQRGTKVFFHNALQDRKLFVIPGIHYFDAHRLRAHLLQAQELQLHPRASIFSVQRLHGFRQVVQHVLLHVANWD